MSLLVQLQSGRQHDLGRFLNSFFVLDVGGTLGVVVLEDLVESLESVAVRVLLVVMLVYKLEFGQHTSTGIAMGLPHIFLRILFIS